MAFSSGGPEMNVTPLIDVLLVLIIIFMLIVPVAPTGEQARIPQEQSGKDEISPVRTIVIQVHQNGGKDTSLRINEEVVTWEALRGRLADIYKERAEKVAFVRADGDVEFEQVARVIDIAHVAGVDNVGLMK